MLTTRRVEVDRILLFSLSPVPAAGIIDGLKVVPRRERGLLVAPPTRVVGDRPGGDLPLDRDLRRTATPGKGALPTGTAGHRPTGDGGQDRDLDPGPEVRRIITSPPDAVKRAHPDRTKGGELKRRKTNCSGKSTKTEVQSLLFHPDHLNWRR